MQKTTVLPGFYIISFWPVMPVAQLRKNTKKPDTVFLHLADEIGRVGIS